MAALDGYIYAIGGYDGTSRLSTVERYCPKTNRWTFVASLANATSKVFAVGLNGFLYAAGTITVYVNTESSH
jgi:hypothetical protein